MSDTWDNMTPQSLDRSWQRLEKIWGETSKSAPKTNKGTGKERTNQPLTEAGETASKG